MRPPASQDPGGRGGSHGNVPRSFRILVAEDNLLLRELLAEYLRIVGWEAETVADGSSALATVAARPPDLLVCDVGLPGLGGLDVCRRLKADPATRRILVILTIGADAEILPRIDAFVADGVLIKPFGLAQLQNLIQTLTRG